MRHTMRIVSVLVVAALFVGVLGDCGCIKCNPHFRVHQTRGCPFKVIYKDNNYCECPKKVPYTVQVPEAPVTPPLRFFGYQVEEPKILFRPEHCGRRYLNFDVQVPVKPVDPVVRLDDLVARPDRVVLQSSSPCDLPREVPEFEVAPVTCTCTCQKKRSYGCGCGRYESPLVLGDVLSSGRCCTVQLLSKTTLVFENLPQNIPTRKKRETSRPRGAEKRKLALFGDKETLTNKIARLNKPKVGDFFERMKEKKMTFAKRFGKAKKASANQDKPEAKTPFWRVDDLRPPEVQASFFKPAERSQKWEDSQLRGVPKWWKKSEWTETPSKLEEWWKNEGPRDRFKRSVKVEDETMLPFYEEEEDSTNEDATQTQNAPVFLNLFEAPLKYLSQLSEPSKNAIPKVLGQSQRFFSEFLRTFGKDAMHLGANLFFPSRNQPKRRKGLLRNKRHLDDAYFEETTYEPREQLESLQKPYITTEEVLGKVVVKAPELARSFDDDDYRRKRNVELPENHDDDPETFLNVAAPDNEDFLGEHTEQAVENLPVAKRKRRATYSPEVVAKTMGEIFTNIFGPLRLQNETKDTLREPKPKNVHVQIIKNAIEDTSSNIQTLELYDSGNDLQLIRDLEKLDALIEKFSDVKDVNLLKLRDLQNLREKTTRGVLSKIHGDETGLQVLFWIEPLLQLQKLHCALHKLTQKLTYGKIDTHLLHVLQKLRVSPSEHTKTIETHSKNLKYLVRSLKSILEEGDPNTLRKEAAILWEFKNVRKLQRATIEELGKKMANGRKRKEMKILFDLHKQYLEVEEKQKQLLQSLKY